jgi:hypothetical protein
MLSLYVAFSRVRMYCIAPCLYYVLIRFQLLTGPVLPIMLSLKAANTVNISVGFKRHLSHDNPVLRWYIVMFCGLHHLLWNYHYLLIFHFDVPIWRQSWGNLHWNITLPFYIKYLIFIVPVPTSARSKANICGRSPAEILGSNRTRGAWMSVCCKCCVLSGRGLCDGPIARPEESYPLWWVIVRGLETSWMRRPWPTGGCRAK